MPTTPELAEQYLMHTGRRLPVTFVRGEGCLLYDEDGKEYLDLVAGIAVNVLGHAHPDIAHALTGQARTLIHTSNLYFTRPQVELARRLVELSFPSRVFICNSGAEANEAAIKLARKWGTKNREGAFEIVTAEGSFHGRTLATVTAGIYLDCLGRDVSAEIGSALGAIGVEATAAMRHLPLGGWRSISCECADANLAIGPGAAGEVDP